MKKLLLIPVLALGLFGFAQPVEANGIPKITICHHTGSQQNPTVTISVAITSLFSHLAHGDTIGACPPVIIPTPSPTFSPPIGIPSPSPSVSPSPDTKGDGQTGTTADRIDHPSASDGSGIGGGSGL